MLMQDVAVNEESPVEVDVSGRMLERVLTGLFVLGLMATMLDFNTLL